MAAPPPPEPCGSQVSRGRSGTPRFTQPWRGVPPFRYNSCWARLCWSKDCGVRRAWTPQLRDGVEELSESLTQLTSTFIWWRPMPHPRNTMNPRVWSLCSKEYYGRPIWRLHMGKGRSWLLVAWWPNRLMLSNHYLCTTARRPLLAS